MTEPLRARLAALLADDPARFPEVVRALPQQPLPPGRDALMGALLELRAAMHDAGDEAREEIVLDMLDWIVGWCSPGSQPFGGNR